MPSRALVTFAAMTAATFLSACHDRVVVPGDGPCAEFGELAGGKQIYPAPTTGALLFPDESAVVLVVHRSDDSGNDVVVVDLPSGSRRAVAHLAGLSDMEWLVPGKRLLLADRLWPPNESHLVLTAQPVEGGPALTLATDVFLYQSSPDGSRVYFVTEWSGGCQNPGTLKVVDVASGATQTIATGVAGESFDVSPDGRSVTFATPAADASCGRCQDWWCEENTTTGTLWEWHLGGTPQVVDPLAAIYSQRYLSSGALLWLRNVYPTESFFVLGKPDGSRVELGRDRRVWDGPFQLSPDESWFTAWDIGGFPHPEDPGSGNSTSYRIAVDGSGAKTLPTDLTSFLTFTPGGEYALYETGGAAKSLAALSLPFWKPRSVAVQVITNSWTVSPQGDAVAFLEPRPEAGGATLRLASLESGATQGLAECTAPRVPNPQLAPSFLPDGRGLLYLEPPEGTARSLSYVPRAGGEVTVLGTTDTSPILVDPRSCLVLFNEAGGTRAALLPP